MSSVSSEENTMTVIRQEDVPARHFQLNELARQCQDDIQQFQQHGRANSHPLSSMELFQRAILQRDEGAWSYIYDLYRGVVGSWIKMYAGADGIVRCDYEEVATLVNATFARFSCAFSPQHLERCTSVSAILRYLKLCTRSTVFDEIREQFAHRAETSLEALAEAGGLLPGERSAQHNEIEEQIIGRLWAQEMWRAIQEELQDDGDARALLSLLYIEDMRPAQIWHSYPRWFATLDDVIQMQRRIRTRLRKNVYIRSLLTGREANTASTRPTIACSLDPVPSEMRAQARETSPTLALPLPLSAQPEEALTDIASVEMSITLAAHEPAIFSAPASSPIVPQKTQAQPAPTIHYRLQNVFCRKPACRKCRDGIGHGPYWYAYRYAHGHTKTIYLGKAVPNEKAQAPAQRKQAAPRVVPQKHGEATISYHLQRTFCGKERCHKCRDDGEGHGPYWYAYRTDGHGRTRRTYVGKTLPDGVLADGSVVKTGASIPEPLSICAPIS